MTTFTDDVREMIGSGSKFGSRRAAAAWLVTLDGAHDEETGDVDEYGAWTARVGRTIVEADSQGFVYGYRFEAEREARQFFATADEYVGSIIEAREREAELSRAGYIEAESVSVTEYPEGSAVRLGSLDGIAFRVVGIPSVEGPNAEWTGLRWWNPDRRLVCMVGDDAVEDVSVNELSPLDDEEFCPSCGQIGCPWH